MTNDTAAIGPDDVLNAIVTRHPATLPVLSGQGFDTCCGGALSLREAARHHGLDLATLLRDLNAAADREA